MASTRASAAADTASSAQNQDASVARKRRLEKLAHKTSSDGPVTEAKIPAPPAAAAVPPKKRKVSPDQTTTTVKVAEQTAENAFKHESSIAKPKNCTTKQMRYEPEVPVSPYDNEDSSRFL